MEFTGIDIFGFGCVFFILAYLGYIVYYAIGLYELNPFLRPAPLSEQEKYILRKNIQILSKLSEDERERFYKRVSWFKAKKPFTYKGSVANKNNIELLISAGGALMTLGMKNYKFIRSVYRIVVYPSDYYSILGKKHHVGEYNVGLKTLVFAADTLLSGFEDGRDNINLAIHEFAHALCFETHNRNRWEAMRFQWGFKKLKAIHSDAEMMAQIKASGYFREYGKTNVFEFFSVLCENFMETPSDFKKQFPDLFALVGKMLNLEF